MEKVVPPYRLIEHISNRVRNEEPRLENESIDGWLKRTWAIVMDEYEKSKPVLPHVVEGQERTARLLKQVGKPVQEKEENE